MKSLFAFAAVMLGIGIHVNAQTVCPSLSVSGPESVDEGQALVFKATVLNPPVGLRYFWSVSSGTIKSGAGTNEIKVDTTGLGDNDITATLELAGVDPNCPSTRSKTASVAKKYVAPEPQKLHQYSAPWPKDEKARLKRIAEYLNTRPKEDQIYIEHFAGRSVSATAAQAERTKVRDMLMANGVAAERRTVVASNKAAKSTFVFWLVPPGAMPPINAQPSAAVLPKAKKVATVLAKDPGNRESDEKILADLKNDPLATSYAILNASPTTPPARLESTRNAVERSMVAMGFAEGQYVVLVNNKAQSDSLEYWTVPLGATPPAIPASKPKRAK